MYTSLTEEYLFVYLNYNLCEGGKDWGVIVVNFDGMVEEYVEEMRDARREEREGENNE